MSHPNVNKKSEFKTCDTGNFDQDNFTKDLHEPELVQFFYFLQTHKSTVSSS